MANKESSNPLINIFKTEDGKIVIGQTPNPPLIAAFLFYLLGFLPLNSLDTISQWGFLVSIIYWSYLEIRYGVNTWRRILGLLVLVLSWWPLLGL